MKGIFLVIALVIGQSALPAVVQIKISDASGSLTENLGEDVAVLKIISNPTNAEVKVSELIFKGGKTEDKLVDLQPVNIGKTDSGEDLWKVGDTITLKETTSNINPGLIYIKIISGGYTIALLGGNVS